MSVTERTYFPVKKRSVSGALNLVRIYCLLCFSTMFGIRVLICILSHAAERGLPIKKIDQVKWGWKTNTSPVRVFVASISVLLTDLASCLFKVGQHGPVPQEEKTMSC